MRAPACTSSGAAVPASDESSTSSNEETRRKSGGVGRAGFWPHFFQSETCISKRLSESVLPPLQNFHIHRPHHPLPRTCGDIVKVRCAPTAVALACGIAFYLFTRPLPGGAGCCCRRSGESRWGDRRARMATGGSGICSRPWGDPAMRPQRRLRRGRACVTADVRGDGAILPRCFQRGKGSACRISGTTAGMASRTRPRAGGGGGRERGPSPRRRPRERRGGRRLCGCARADCLGKCLGTWGMLFRTRPQGEGGAGSPLRTSPRDCRDGRRPRRRDRKGYTLRLRDGCGGRRCARGRRGVRGGGCGVRRRG